MTLGQLSRLRWPLLTSLVLAAAGAWLVWTAKDAYQVQRQALRREEEAFRQGRDRLQRAEREEAEIRETIGRFRALEARGVVGPEQRLEWIERLRTARERLQLPALDYELRPRRALEGGPAPAPATGYRLATSTMRLRAELVQEEDLLRLLDDLRAEPSAIVRPMWCRVARSETGGRGLAAECEVDWITVEPGRQTP